MASTSGHSDMAKLLLEGRSDLIVQSAELDAVLPVANNRGFRGVVEMPAACGEAGN